MASTFTTNLQFEKIADNEQENTWGTTYRRTLDEADKAIAGHGTLTSSAGTNTVSSADFLNHVLTLTGSATANIVHLMPARAKTWWIYNQHTHGAFTVQLQPSGGTAVTILPGYDGMVRSDGTTAFLPSGFIRGTAVGDVNMADYVMQRPTLRDYGETVVTSTHTTSAGTATINLESGNVHDLTLAAAGTNTLAFANWPTAGAGNVTVYVRQDATGGRVLAYPAAVAWADSDTPVLSTSSGAIDRLTFETLNGGTAIYGAIAGQGFS